MLICIYYFLFCMGQGQLSQKCFYANSSEMCQGCLWIMFHCKSQHSVVYKLMEPYKNTLIFFSDKVPTLCFHQVLNQNKIDMLIFSRVCYSPFISHDTYWENVHNHSDWMIHFFIIFACDQVLTL